ncbi:MAG: hypothetical protein A3H44_09225 [Gammaproteobacteria bacterium RIFCSPLOWO2_02_FULL_57_10]|nr:MAG: hypothetical protein A3H44_09225 [Gammaproteobacteria bacterium RIFCSPLOWO2_02_FULL_57_10]
MISIEAWINLQTRSISSYSQSISEAVETARIDSLTENIINAIIRPEVLPSLVIMLGCLIYADRNSYRFVELMDNLSLLGGVFLFPLFVLVLAAYSLADSLLVFAGSGSAIAWLRSFLEHTSESEFIRDCISIAIHLMMFLPLILLLAILIYGGRLGKG